MPSLKANCTLPSCPEAHKMKKRTKKNKKNQGTENAWLLSAFVTGTSLAFSVPWFFFVKTINRLIAADGMNCRQYQDRCSQLKLSFADSPLTFEVLFSNPSHRNKDEEEEKKKKTKKNQGTENARLVPVTNADTSQAFSVPWFIFFLRQFID